MQPNVNQPSNQPDNNQSASQPPSPNPVNGQPPLPPTAPGQPSAPTQQNNQFQQGNTFQSNPQAQTYIPPSQQHSANLFQPRNLMIAGAAVVLLLVGAIVFATSGDDTSDSLANDNYDYQLDEDYRSSYEQEEEAAEEVITKNKIDKEMDAKALGIKIKFTELISPLMPLNEYGRLVEPYDDDVELIALKMTAENYGDYSVTFSNSTLDITTDKGDGKVSYVISKSEMEELGLDRLEADSIKNGEKNSGYVIYEIPKGATKIEAVWDVDTKVLFGDDIKEKYTTKIR